MAGIRSIRSKTPKLSDEGIQQLEQEVTAASAQAIISNNEITHDVNRLRKQLPQMQGEMGAFRMVQEYSKIVMRSLDIQKEVFKMALNIKDDLKELLYGRIDDLKGGKNKGWYVAVSSTLWGIFLLYWFFIRQWIVAEFGIPFP